MVSHLQACFLSFSEWPRSPLQCIFSSLPKANPRRAEATVFAYTGNLGSYDSDWQRIYMAETQAMDRAASAQLPLASHPLLSSRADQPADPGPTPKGLLSPGINIELHSDSEATRPATAGHS